MLGQIQSNKGSVSVSCYYRNCGGKLQLLCLLNCTSQYLFLGYTQNFFYLILPILQTLAHEAGHNLGMSHDFVTRKKQVNGKCRKENTGSETSCNQCTNWNTKTKMLKAQTGASGECCTGFMNYGPHPEYWSDCSVRMFEKHYTSRNWKKCMPKGILCSYIYWSVYIHLIKLFQ